MSARAKIKSQKKTSKVAKRSLAKLHPDLAKIVKLQDTWREADYLMTSSFSIKSTWKDLKRNWGHSLHSMASRSGSFPPALANYFIENFSEEEQLVLDPFSGKGTTALQSCLVNRIGIGTDVAPEAYALTAAKVLKINNDRALQYLDSLKISKRAKSLIKDVPHEVKVFYHDETLIQLISFMKAIKADYDLAKVDYSQEDLEIFEQANTYMQDILGAWEDPLASDMKRSNKSHIQGLRNEDDGSWVSLNDQRMNERNAVGEGLESVSLSFSVDERSHFAQYWVGVLIGILHGSSELSLSVSCSHSFSMAPGYVEKYSKKHGLEKPKRDLKECLMKRSEKLQEDIKAGKDLQCSGRALLCSAMDLPDYMTDTVDLIVTSPPYFTAQTYAWDNWLREWFLGFDFKQVRTKTLHTAVVQKYADAMRQQLAESYRVLKPGTWAFYVVGDVHKKTVNGKEVIITADIIAQEAKKVGFDVELIINDDIPQTSCYNSAFLKKDQGLKLDRVVCLYKA